MSEIAQARSTDAEPGHVTRVTDTVFEPEILAFCCEH
jgi:hypothetical protein